MEIKCEERYQEALDHVEVTNDKTLQNCLDQLKLYERDGKYRVILYKDFAPLSFCFEKVNKEGIRIMNGGVLYHGNPDESRGYQLVPSKGWQIHT